MLELLLHTKCALVYNAANAHYSLMRTAFNVISIDRYSLYLTVNTVFIFKE